MSLVVCRGATVILETQPELALLLAGTEGAIQVIACGRKLPRFDLHCPLMSLPRAFGTTAETIPPPPPSFRVSAAHAERWAQRLPAQGRLVGIA